MRAVVLMDSHRRRGLAKLTESSGCRGWRPAPQERGLLHPHKSAATSRRPGAKGGTADRNDATCEGTNPISRRPMPSSAQDAFCLMIAKESGGTWSKLVRLKRSR